MTNHEMQERKKKPLLSGLRGPNTSPQLTAPFICSRTSSHGLPDAIGVQTWYEKDLLTYRSVSSLSLTNAPCLQRRDDFDDPRSLHQ
jgi:hypothetical protein